tara:strand:+ start:6614 stop:7135 length:522 start_codon:yes stop_codon:yes gene_type:complete
MGYLKNTINVQHAQEPLVNTFGDSSIVDQTTKSVELTISSVVPADRKIFCAPTVGTATLLQAGIKPGMVIINANGFGREIETVADDFIIVNTSGNFFQNQKIFAYAKKTDGVLLYIGRATAQQTFVTAEVVTAGGETVDFEVPVDALPYVLPVQVTKVLSLQGVVGDSVLYLF